MENWSAACEDVAIVFQSNSSMQEVHRHAIVPHTANEMFALVDKVEDYAEFLPWCSRSEELERSDEHVLARLTLQKSVIRQSFTTRNRHRAPDSIDLELVDGPFDSLRGRWQFQAIGERVCKVTLDLEFAITDRILKKTLEPVFLAVMQRLIDAFKQRAAEVYNV